MVRRLEWPGLVRRTLVGAAAAVCLAAVSHAAEAGKATEATDGLPVIPVVRVPVDEQVTLTIWNRDITTFRATIGDNTPRWRATHVAEKIRNLTQRELNGEVIAQPASVGAVHGYMVMLEETVILSLVLEDADVIDNLSADSRQAVLRDYANQTAANLHEALTARARQQQLPVLVRGAAVSLAVTLLLVAWVWMVVRLRKLALEAIAKHPMNLTGKRIFEIELGPQIVELQKYLVRLAAVLAIFAGAYPWITFVFSQFPYSEPWGDSLGAFLISIAHRLWMGVVDATPGLVMVVAILFLNRFLVRIVSGLFASIERGIIKVSWLNPDTARATRRLLVLSMWAFAATVAYPYIPGSNTDAFKGISVLLGLMISLGSTGLVNQIMSGLVVVYSGAVHPGEYVRFGQIEGTVTEVGLLATSVETARRESVSIPNSLLVTDATVNYSRLAGAKGVLVSTSVTIGYDTPWRQVQAMLLEAASRTGEVLEDPAPVVRQTALSDFFVEYNLLVRLAQPQKRLLVLSDLHANILDVFNEYGVQIMSPHFEAQPDGAVLVAKDRWFSPPAKAEEPEN